MTKVGDEKQLKLRVSKTCFQQKIVIYLIAAPDFFSVRTSLKYKNWYFDCNCINLENYKKNSINAILYQTVRKKSI